MAKKNFIRFNTDMNIPSVNNQSSFHSRCPEVKLGQQICRVVNNEFPHYSMTKFQPIIKKHISKTKKPSAVMLLTNKLYNDRPSFQDEALYPNYFSDLFSYIQKYHSFNCQESSLLSALMLKLNGIKNVYTAGVRKGDAKIDHRVCFFNRDGSKYDNRIKNNQTIIVDPWTGICDFAGKVFKEYSGFWSEHLKSMANRADGKYDFRTVESIDLPEKFLNSVKENYPGLKL